MHTFLKLVFLTHNEIVSVPSLSTFPAHISEPWSSQLPAKGKKKKKALWKHNNHGGALLCGGSGCVRQAKQFIKLLIMLRHFGATSLPLNRCAQDKTEHLSMLRRILPSQRRDHSLCQEQPIFWWAKIRNLSDEQLFKSTLLALKIIEFSIQNPRVLKCVAKHALSYISAYISWMLETYSVLYSKQRER